MFYFYLNRHIFHLFVPNFLWDLNISCGLDPQNRGEKDSLLDMNTKVWEFSEFFHFIILCHPFDVSKVLIRAFVWHVGKSSTGCSLKLLNWRETKDWWSSTLAGWGLSSMSWFFLLLRINRKNYSWKKVLCEVTQFFLWFIFITYTKS